MSTVAAALAASFVVSAFAVLAPPRRRLRARLGPYLDLGRSRLGRGVDGRGTARLVMPAEGTVVTRIFGPSLSVAAARLGRVIDATDHDLLVARLRQAGRGSDVTHYRLRQLGATVAGAGTGVVASTVTVGSLVGSIVMFVCFGFAGATFHRSRLDRAIAERSARLRSEVPTLAQLMAVHLRTGHGPVEAVRLVSMRSCGPGAADLREALGSISGGLPPQEAYEQLAETTAEPMAARLYRLLAASVRSGGDIVGPLMAISNEVRADQREALARASVKRRTAMIAPLLLLVAPVMVLFVAAALPALVFGR